MILQTFKKLKYGSFITILALFVSGNVAIMAQSQPVSRQDILKQTFQLLDKIEADYPQSQADVVKIRERVMGLYKTPAKLDPQISYARRQRAAARRNDWQEFYKSIKNLKNKELAQALKNKLQKQRALKYSDSRRYVMLNVDKEDNYIECIYTGKIIKADKMPDSKILNIEHSWPQSKGATGIAKSDLHHLFATDPVANSTRGSLPFGQVENPKWQKGGSECDGKRFEARKKFRGDVARALFYFSVRYDKSIDARQEEVLRQWHQQDPVDAHEKARNDRVEKIQWNRNPFIDCPQLIQQISDF